MSQKYQVILFILCWTLTYFVSSFAQEPIKENLSKVGGLKLPDRAFGFFSTARHINKDTTFTNYVNYHTRFALWVGAVNSKGETLVTAGTGNEVTRRPEWSPIHPSFQVISDSVFPQVKKTVSLLYSDAEPFEGHVPLGLQVEQKVYEFKNSRFAVLNFAISMDSKAEPLKEVYVGFWADVDAPNSEDRQSRSNDKLGLALQGLAPFIFDNSIKGTEIPLLGAMILGVKDPIVSWWTVEEDPVGNEQQYAYLKGEIPITDPDEPGDYRFLLSYGALTLSAGETIHFPVALVQTPQVNDFKDNLNDAREFFLRELGGVSLKKQSLPPSTQAASLALVPSAFRLYPNFPNPFNPQTQIQFDLPEAAQVELRIYNALGQLVRTLVDESYPAGTFTIAWDGRDEAGRVQPSGIYFYRIQAGDFQAQRKLLLLK